MMTNAVNVVVVGVGYLGRIHARIYHEMPEAVLVAVVDKDRNSADQTARQFDCKAFYDLESFFESGIAVDAVSVVVPTRDHRAIARPFLERKVPMLLEKPVAATLEESKAIVELARKQNVILQIGHLERFNAGVMKLAELVDEPKFIEVHRLGEFVGRATDVDVVTDLMIHDIDIILTMVPAEISRISATGTSVVTGHTDIANARLEFDNGTVANVTASRISRNRFRRIRVFSEGRYLGLNFADQQLEEITFGGTDPATGFPRLTERRIPVTPQPPLNAELFHFVTCIQDGKQPLVSGNDGLVAMEVAELVKREISDSLEKIDDRRTVS